MPAARMRKWRHRAFRLPHLRLLFRHVHRQFDELPDRGARPVPAGNGSLLATHADRKELFLRAGRIAVDLAKRYYEKDDASALPRSIATFEAFENAMCLDIAMGGSTNTVLHLLAAAHEAGVDFTMKDIDRLSHKVPHLAKVAPSTSFITWKTCTAPAASWPSSASSTVPA